MRTQPLFEGKSALHQKRLQPIPQQWLFQIKGEIETINTYRRVVPTIFIDNVEYKIIKTYLKVMKFPIQRQEIDGPSC